MDKYNSRKIDSSQLDCPEDRITQTSIELNEYRKTLPRKKQRDFIAFVAKLSQDAKASGDSAKSIRLAVVHANLESLFLIDSGE